MKNNNSVIRRLVVQMQLLKMSDWTYTDLDQEFIKFVYGVSLLAATQNFMCYAFISESSWRLMEKDKNHCLFQAFIK